jgi:NAD-dependent SIR2 family protein deacetylase
MRELAGMVRGAADTLASAATAPRTTAATGGDVEEAKTTKAWDPSRPGASPLVVFTGAGISTACGIPDFRGPNGVWTLRNLNGGGGNGGSNGPAAPARPSSSSSAPPPAAVSFTHAKPSLAHMALVRLHSAGLLSLVVSQNVDGLHLRSGLPRQALAELHGASFAERCEKCGAEWVRDAAMPSVGFRATGRVCERRVPVTAAASGRGRGRGTRGGAGGGRGGGAGGCGEWRPVPWCYVANGNPPGTEAGGFSEAAEATGAAAAEDRLCDGVLRDQCLDWDDPLPPRELREAERRASAAAVSLCLGTSLQIRPAGDLPLRTVRAGGQLAIVNLQPTPKDRRAAVVCRARCDEAMAALLDALGLEAPDFVRHDRVRVSHVASAWGEEEEEAERCWGFELRVASVHGAGFQLPPLLRHVEVAFEEEQGGGGLAAAAFDLRQQPAARLLLVVRRNGLSADRGPVTAVLRLFLDEEEEDGGGGGPGAAAAGAAAASSCRELRYEIAPPPSAGNRSEGASTLVFETQRAAYGARQRALMEELRRRAEAEEQEEDKARGAAVAGGGKQGAAAAKRRPRAPQAQAQRYGERQVVEEEVDEEGGQDGEDGDDEDFKPPRSSSAAAAAAVGRGAGGGGGAAAAATARPRKAPKVLDL